MDADAGGGGSVRAFVQPEGRRIAALGETRRTGIHEQYALEVFLEFPDVRMAEQVSVDGDSVQFRVAGRQGVERICREAFGHKDVPVAQEKGCAFVLHDGVFVLDREFEHHQIDVGVAVAAYGGDGVAVGE